MQSDDWVIGDWSAAWRGWIRTELSTGDQEGLRAALTAAQQATLLQRDYVWVKGIGVLWTAPDGCLRRAQYTHGTHFLTRRGEFYIDSQGHVRASVGAVSHQTRGRHTSELETAVR